MPRLASIHRQLRAGNAALHRRPAHGSPSEARSSISLTVAGRTASREKYRAWGWRTARHFARRSMAPASEVSHWVRHFCPGETLFRDAGIRPASRTPVTAICPRLAVRRNIAVTKQKWTHHGGTVAVSVTSVADAIPPLTPTGRAALVPAGCGGTPGRICCSRRRCSCWRPSPTCRSCGSLGIAV